MEDFVKRSRQLPGLAPFHLDVHYVAIDERDRRNVRDAHTHEECEIYVNVSGNVAFMVEDRVYPIAPGSVVISRPHEYHHCIYRGPGLHRHYWMLFSSAGNEALFPRFFDRPRGRDNLIVLPAEETKRLFSLCAQLKEESGELESYRLFFSLLALLEHGRPEEAAELSPDVSLALSRIRAASGERLSVEELAAAAAVSVNTLERHFRRDLGMSPTLYLRRHRLARAAELLRAGRSVQEACEESGFPDYPHFIAFFREVYGQTPLQYKKSLP